MTNQSKWLVSAYAIFFCGGVLVPLDYKLTAEEHLQLLAHSKAKFLIVEYHLWRAIMQSPEFRIGVKTVLVTEAPLRADLGGAYRWEDFHRKGEPIFMERDAEDVACIVYSSGTGGRAEGMRADARELPGAVHVADCVVSVLAGGAVSEHPADESRDRFHGGIYRTLCVRSVRCASAHLAPGVCAGRVRALPDHLHELWSRWC